VVALLALSGGIALVGALVVQGLKSAGRWPGSDRFSKYSALPAASLSWKIGPVVDEANGETTIRFDIVNKTRGQFWFRTDGDALRVDLSRQVGEYLQPMDVVRETRPDLDGVRRLDPGEQTSGLCRFRGRTSLARDTRVYILLKAFDSEKDAKSATAARIAAGPPIDLGN
jgi:hypothetical protein